MYKNILTAKNACLGLSLFAVISLGTTFPQDAHAAPTVKSLNKKVSSLTKTTKSLNKRLLSVESRASVAGAQGVQGVKGDTGATGAQGLKGDQGDDGAQGIAGVQGPVGEQGPIGEQGPQGPQGIQGAEGLIKTIVPGPADAVFSTLTLPTRTTLSSQLSNDQFLLFPKDEIALENNRMVNLRVKLSVKPKATSSALNKVTVEICPTLNDCKIDGTDADRIKDHRIVGTVSASAPANAVANAEYDYENTISFMLPKGWFYRVYKDVNALPAQGFLDTQAASIKTSYFDLQ